MNTSWWGGSNLRECRGQFVTRVPETGRDLMFCDGGLITRRGASTVLGGRAVSIAGHFVSDWTLRLERSGVRVVEPRRSPALLLIAVLHVFSKQEAFERSENTAVPTTR